MNHEGYRDPTAETALKRVKRIRRRNEDNPQFGYQIGELEAFRKTLALLYRGKSFNHSWTSSTERTTLYDH